ncbi:FKBP-type peptidyl-prolyl cis-trans isomerase [Maribacter sp. MAR_2009_72]|uniref:FKBP-type peptidyl-prolyl cis-trans isomerase n=1 Tax=Maribacter sp. MAR_2009_72 TaxID=1250050 RepID=UPI001198DD1A|nr:FKBP-type peptidyl-prolyl cis-trans isomerase [Maribacter sp. MAR_2009_72]TVZ14679.1 FKBP-type peptidyl-prolyl cis-trans isomerase FkpA [Maribacter sp. MAR_2009_72]
MKKCLVPLLLLLVVSCLPDNSKSEIPTTDFTAANEEEIITYINDNNLDAQKSASGLYYVIENQGTGAAPTASSDVTVAYKGYFSDGSVFDDSQGDGITFNLSGVIAGWTEGITYFNEGGSGILLIPSRLAYGNAGRSGIPGGAVLIFDIELQSVN